MLPQSTHLKTDTTIQQIIRGEQQHVVVTREPREVTAETYFTNLPPSKSIPWSSHTLSSPPLTPTLHVRGYKHPSQALIHRNNKAATEGVEQAEDRRSRSYLTFSLKSLTPSSDLLSLTSLLFPPHTHLTQDSKKILRRRKRAQNRRDPVTA